MSEEHTNITLLSKLDILNLDAPSHLFSATPIWRIVSGRFAEAWDIPSAYTEAT
jgi:hypothetical protein